MTRHENSTVSANRLWSRASLYQIVVALVGWAAYALLASAGAAQAGWADIAIFALVSIGVKQLGFHVAHHVTHSLVGVIDLAALFSMGDFGAATVACVSSGICQSVLCESDDDLRSIERWRAVAFVSGLNVLKVTVSAWAYRMAGGTIPLVAITWPSLLPVLVAGITWFTLDHACWCAYTWLSEGFARARVFLHRILPYSLAVELFPLPLAAAISNARHGSAPLFLLVCTTALGAGFVVQALMTSLSKERRHVRELSTIGELGRNLLDAQLDVVRVCHLIYEACSRIAEAPVFALRLHDSDDQDAVGYCVVAGHQVTAEPQLLRTDTVRHVLNTRRPLLINDFDVRLPPIEIGPPARSGLYIPIVQDRNVLGLIALQSPDRNAYQPEDREALELLAAQAAIGLQTARLYQQERRRSAQLLAISHVTQQVAALKPLPELMADTVYLVADAFGYYHVALFTVDSNGRRILFQAASSPLIQNRGLDVPWGTGVIGTAASSAETLLVNDVRQDSRFRDDTALPETRSEMAVPLTVEDRIVGILDVQSDVCNAFGKNDIFVLETLAAQIAIAVEDSRLYQAQQEQAWVSTALQQVAEAITSLTEPEDVLNTVARLALMFGGIDRCAIFVWHEEERAFGAVAGEGWPIVDHTFFEGYRLQPSSVPLLDRVREQNQTLVAPSEELYDSLPPHLWQGPHTERVICIPLRIKGEPVGVLVADGLRPSEELSEHRLSILQGIAHYAALGLESTRLYASQREEAWVSTALLQVANSMTASPDVRDVVSTIIRLIPMLVGVDWCAVLVWDDESQTFSLRQGHAISEPDLARILPDRGPDRNLEAIRAFVASSQPQVLSDARSEGLVPPSSTAPDLGTVALLPLHARAKPLGLLLAGQRNRAGYAERSMAILSGIASQAALAIEAAQLYAQTVQQQRLEREIELARDIQQSFLPEGCPQIPGWQIAVEWRAARGVGGDFYDFIHLGDNRLGIVIADVSDKGVGAALYMALSRTVLRTAALDASGPADALRRANRVLVDDNRSGMFVTMLYSILDTRTGRLRYGRAGHTPGFWVHRATRSVESLCPPGVVLGITDRPEIAEEEITLERGDALVLYTDGVTDALDEASNEFGEERLIALLHELAPGRADEMVHEIDRRVRTFSGKAKQFDDFTLLVVTRD